MIHSFDFDPLQTTIGSLFRQRALEAADQPFLIYEDETYRFGELDRMTDQLAAGFSRLGVTKGDRVLLDLGNQPEIVMAYLGLVKLGAVAVPINPASTARELAYYVRNAEPSAVVFMEQVAPAFAEVLRGLEQVPGAVVVVRPQPQGGAGAQEAAAPLADVERLVREGGGRFLHWEEVLALTAEPFRGAEVTPEDPALILYTSGTTGVPKGAILTQGGLLYSAHSVQGMLQLDAEYRVISPLPCYHLFFVILGWLTSLTTGGTVIVEPTFTPRRLLTSIERHRATFLYAVPSMFILACQLLEKESAYDLSSLRLSLSGGAPVPAEYQQRWLDLAGSPVVQAYGATEYGLGAADDVARPVVYGATGFPGPGMDLTIMGADGRLLGPREVGEIVVRTPGCMTGYWKMPEKTAAVLHDGWFHTEDLGYLDEEGRLYVVDRLKDLILFGGENIYPKEVEDVVYSHPAVSECALVGIPDPVKGEEPWLFLTLKDGVATGRDTVQREIVELCRSQLASFKVPRRVTLIDAFPKTSTGKIRKVDLRQAHGRREDTKASIALGG